MNSQFFAPNPPFEFTSFVDDRGAPLLPDEIMQTFQERGQRVQKLVLPRTVEAARAHFGCPTLNGAELEDDGGDGSAATHWEERIFDGELMDASSAQGGKAVLTDLTLAFLEDTGWCAVHLFSKLNIYFFKIKYNFFFSNFNLIFFQN